MAKNDKSQCKHCNEVMACGGDNKKSDKNKKSCGCDK